MSALTFTTKVVSSGADGWRSSPTVCLQKPKDCAPLLALLAQAEAKAGGYVTARLDLPHRPRTTGPRSQNSRFYGHCEDIAEQIDDAGKPVYTKEQIHDAMLRMSVSEGYPTYLDLNGIEAPLPSAQASIEQLNIVLRVQQRYADEHELWLTEYIEKGPLKGMVYKSIGGRSFEEMQRFAPELNADVRLYEEKEK